MGRRKTTVTKSARKPESPLAKFAKEQVPQRQIFARVPADKADKFIEILDRENLSIYEGVEIAISMLIQYYEKKKL